MKLRKMIMGVAVIVCVIGLQTTDVFARGNIDDLEQYYEELSPNGLIKIAYIVTADSANVYSSRSTSSEVIGKLYKGDYISPLSTKNGWAKLNYGSKTGYMELSNLKRE